MDMLMLGETISATTDADESIGFWMPSGGSQGVAGVEVFRASGSSVFTVHMDTKKSDEADTAATSIRFTSVGEPPGVFKFDVEDAEDLVRYRVASGGDSDRNIHLQFLQPLWAPN